MDSVVLEARGDVFIIDRPAAETVYAPDDFTGDPGAVEILELTAYRAANGAAVGFVKVYSDAFGTTDDITKFFRIEGISWRTAKVDFPAFLTANGTDLSFAHEAHLPS